MQFKDFIVIGLLCLSSQILAQSITITKPLELIPHSSITASYAEFSHKENLELDIPMPYSLIILRIVGNANDVIEAKKHLTLYLGQQHLVEETNHSIPNEMRFLISNHVKNVFLECGEGCERVILYSGRLHPNYVYCAQIQYNTLQPINNSSFGFVKWSVEPANSYISIPYHNYHGGLNNDTLTYLTYPKGLSIPFTIQHPFYAPYFDTILVTTEQEQIDKKNCLNAIIQYSSCSS